MHFITQSPLTLKEHDVIFVIVDKGTYMVPSIPNNNTTFSAEKVAEHGREAAGIAHLRRGGVPEAHGQLSQVELAQVQVVKVPQVPHQVPYLHTSSTQIDCDRDIYLSITWT